MSCTIWSLYERVESVCYIAGDDELVIGGIGLGGSPVLGSAQAGLVDGGSVLMKPELIFIFGFMAGWFWSLLVFCVSGKCKEKDDD